MPNQSPAIQSARAAAISSPVRATKFHYICISRVFVGQRLASVTKSVKVSIQLVCRIHESPKNPVPSLRANSTAGISLAAGCAKCPQIRIQLAGISTWTGRR
nr:hypothetical protein [Streptomyces sp. 846.5]